MKKTVLFPIVLAVAAGMLTGGCSRGATSGRGNAGVPVLVAQSVATNVPVQIDPPPVGHVMPISTVTVHSQIGGIIRQVNFKEGDEVKSNALLFTIDPRPTQAALDQARANLERDSGQSEYQKANYLRDQKLLAAKIISQEQSDTDQASLDAATGTMAADKAAITNALLNLEFCYIRSPIDGKTGGLQAYAGNVVKAPDDVLLTINQIHPIYVEFAVPEQFLPEIKKQMAGQIPKAAATFENMDGPPPQGELTFIDNSVDMTTGTILLKATFPNEDNVLWPGQFVNVTLTLSELTNAIVVPSQAVQTGQNNQYVYVVKPNPTNAAMQVVEQRPVTTGINYQNETVIVTGIQAGETVVTDGQLRLAPGVAVSVRSSTQPAAPVSVSNAP
jgi:multidrug efflux system membrane fusion protein